MTYLSFLKLLKWLQNFPPIFFLALHPNSVFWAIFGLWRVTHEQEPIRAEVGGLTPCHELISPPVLSILPHGVFQFTEILSMELALIGTVCAFRPSATLLVHVVSQCKRLIITHVWNKEYVNAVIFRDIPSHFSLLQPTHRFHVRQADGEMFDAWFSTHQSAIYNQRDQLLTNFGNSWIHNVL